MRITSIWILAILTLVGCDETSLTPISKAQFMQANISFKNIGIVTDGMVKKTYSDEVSSKDMTLQLRKAITSELLDLQGDTVYNLGVKVTDYMLANPTVPTVSSPKSVLMLSVSVWDDSPDPHLILPPVTVTVVDGSFGASFIITKPQGDKGHRLEALSAKAGVEIAQYLARNAQILDASKLENSPAVAVPSQDAAQLKGIVNCLLILCLENNN